MKKQTPSFWRTELIVRRITLVAVIAAVLIAGPNVFGKTASCPCSPCKCSPCTCGAGGPSKGGKHHEKKGEHEHGGVGVGLNVDLGGVGQRKAEPNPFATTNAPPSSQTQEKPKTKKIDKSIDTTFDKVELTTAKAKEHEKPDPFAQVELTGEKGKGQSTPAPVDQTTKP